MHTVLCVPGSVGLPGCCELLEPGHRRDASRSPGTRSCLGRRGGVPNDCSPGGSWAGSPGVMMNVDGVLGQHSLAVARDPVGDWCWELPGRQGCVSLSPLGGFLSCRGQL